MIKSVLLKDRLKQIYADYAADYKTAVNKSLATHMQTLSAGETIPEARFFTEAEREAFSSRALGYRQKAQGYIREELDKVAEEKAKAPTDEALRAVQMLKMKSTITDGDLDNLVNAYGENYLTYEAIRGIAKDNDIYGLDKHDLDRYSDSLNNIMHDTNNIDVYHAERGGTDDGYVSFYGALLDSQLR